MRFYPFVNPQISGAIVIISALLVIFIVACETEATQPTEQDSVTAEDDEGDETPRKTDDAGDSRDDGDSPDDHNSAHNDDSNPELDEVVEDTSTDEENEEDDGPPPAALEALGDPQDAMVDLTHLRGLDLHEDDAAVGDDSIGDGNAGKRPGVDMNPTVHFDEPDVEGAIEKELVHRVTRQNRRAILNCYESELRRTPDLEGEVLVRWVIAPSGDVVTAAIVTSTLDERWVEQCLTQRIRRWKFPEPEDGGIARVHSSFEFSVEE